MSLLNGQPKVRFGGHYNPGDIAAISYLPKVLTVRKTVTGTSNETIMSCAPGTVITRVFGICKQVSASTNAAVSVGLSADADAFLDPTEMLLDSTATFATNIGSTVAGYPNGYHFGAADTVKLAVTGSTVTNGQVEVVIEYYELGEMFVAGGIHVDL